MADVTRSPLAPLTPTSAALRLVWLRIRRNWPSAIALVLIVAMMLAAVLANWIAPYEPDATDAEAAPRAVASPLAGNRHLRPRPASRIIFAARVDLALSLVRRRRAGDRLDDRRRRRPTAAW
jgi:peptide/nickel transport system permease protein